MAPSSAGGVVAAVGVHGEVLGWGGALSCGIWVVVSGGSDLVENGGKSLNTSNFKSHMILIRRNIIFYLTSNLSISRITPRDRNRRAKQGRQNKRGGEGTQ